MKCMYVLRVRHKGEEEHKPKIIELIFNYTTRKSQQQKYGIETNFGENKEKVIK